jgi:hypothetical protein
LEYIYILIEILDSRYSCSLQEGTIQSICPSLQYSIPTISHILIETTRQIIIQFLQHSICSR